MQAVILAGGKGTRLLPLTKNIPKPLVPIGERAILEIILIQLKKSGFKKIVIAVNHLSHLIKSHFGNGEKLGLSITYSEEKKPLGTAGPLSIINNLEENFLVMNGDILSNLNFKKLFNYHLKKKSLITISTYMKNLPINLGVVEFNKGKFINYFEKPNYNFKVSMGIYIMNIKVLELIKKNQYCDLPNLIINANKKKRIINEYYENCEWLDIGRHEDYEYAKKIFKKNIKKFI